MGHEQRAQSELLLFVPCLGLLVCATLEFRIQCKQRTVPGLFPSATVRYGIGGEKSKTPC
jgi:hypothetical protein